MMSVGSGVRAWYGLGRGAVLSPRVARFRSRPFRRPPAHTTPYGEETMPKKTGQKAERR